MSLGSWLSIAGGIVAIAVSGGALGIIAGSLLVAGGAAQMGVFGSAGKNFMSSGWGQGLMAAAALASVGTSLYGDTAVEANTAAGVANAAANPSVYEATDSAATQAADAAGAGTPLAAANTAQQSLSDAIPTATDFTGAAGTGGTVNSVAAGNGALNTASTPGSVAPAYNNGPMGADSVQASMGQDTNLQAAANGGNAGGANAGPGLSGATRLQAPAGDAGATGASAPTADTAGAPQGPPVPDNTTSTESAYDADMEAGGQPNGAAGPGAPGSSSGSVLGSALKDPKVLGGIAQGGLSMIGGLGSGMLQSSAMQKQIAAQQWGNAQWQDPNQVAQFEAAAAQPITVPTGYLQRAQQIRSMMSGGVPTPSSGPVPMSSAMAPPGVGGPVPMSAMGAPGGAMAAPTPQNPRGGAI